MRVACGVAALSWSIAFASSLATLSGCVDAGSMDDRTGAAARTVALDCEGESCRCDQRGGACVEGAAGETGGGYWFYDDVTECAGSTRCAWDDTPACSGNVDEHVWLIVRDGGALASFDDRPRDPRRGLLGCGGREIYLAEGSCSGPRVVTCRLETRWDREDPDDPRAYLYDAIDGSRGCERLAEPSGPVVACVDKDGDGDTLDAGEQSVPLATP